MPRDSAATVKRAPELTFDPERPTDWTPQPHRDVIVVPWGENQPGGARRAAGLFDADGRFMAEGHCWRGAGRPITVPPIPPVIGASVERLSGTWLFGGLFYSHFGHFLVESTARLWALGQTADVRGIVFYPKQAMTHERRHYRDLLPFFDALDLSDLEVRVPQTPVIVERLLTPPPGFGLGAMMAGSREYRAWMRATLGKHVPPFGADRIYVSRRGLIAKRGSVLFEAKIEALMAAAGYTIVHPQAESLTTQIAHWKSARRIVAADGSALHLAALVARDDAEVAILNRGPSTNIADYITQFRAFAGIEPVRIDTVTGYYHREDRPVVKRETHAMLDLPATGQALAEAGFIPSADGWDTPDDSARHAAVATLEEKLGAAMTYHPA